MTPAGASRGMASDGASNPQQGAKAALALLLTGLGLWTLHRYLPALIWAAILAIAVWPLYQRAGRRWPPRKGNVVLPSVFTMAIALVFIIPLVLVAVQAGKEVHGVFESIAQARSDGIPPPQWLSHLPVGSQQATNWWQENLANPDSANALLQKARQSQFVSNSREIGADLAHRAVLFGFMLLTLFFLFRDGDRFTAQLQRASARACGPAGDLVRPVHRHRRHGAVRRASGVRNRGIDPADPRIGGRRDQHRRAGHGGGVRRRSLHPSDPDRKRHAAAVPLGAAGYFGRRGDLGTAGPVPRPGDHGSPDPAVAGMGWPGRGFVKSISDPGTVWRGVRHSTHHTALLAFQPKREERRKCGI
jgi:hypothetical protein